MQTTWSGSHASTGWARGAAVAAVVVALGGWGPVPAGAQTRVSNAPTTQDSPVDRQIRVIEQVLEQAVGASVQRVERQLPALAPGLLFFTGAIQTRGFALEGYGLFFDVEYPPLRRSILWSMRALNQLNANMAQIALADATANLRRQMQSMQEGPGRDALAETLRELEAQVRPLPPHPSGAGWRSAVVRLNRWLEIRRRAAARAARIGCAVRDDAHAGAHRCPAESQSDRGVGCTRRGRVAHRRGT